MGISDSLKHFEALQKRYTTQHNGTACEHVKLALEGLRRMAEGPDIVRCGDCQHAHETGLRDPRILDCEKNGLVFSHGYCNYGKRMDADAPERGGEGG